MTDVNNNAASTQTYTLPVCPAAGMATPASSHGGGRDGGRSGSRLRGLDAVSGSSIDTGRFGRMFRWLPASWHSDDALEALATSMIQKGDKGTAITEPEPEDENPTIPAGYTYLGQFIDHDITFDPVSSLTKQNDPDALVDFRTPRLDLDSVYGSGPADQPYLYQKDEPRKLLLGDDRAPTGLTSRPDLPRNSEHVALIGDPRNDENRIVSQLHALFIRFHNRVVDTVVAANPNATFEECQRIVRWHYQWIVVHEYLPRIVGATTASAVRGTDGRPMLRHFKPRSSAYMPVEFSVAAYRFGHSQVRPSYSLSAAVLHTGDETSRIPVFTNAKGKKANLNGFQPLPKDWGIDWRFYFDGLDQAGLPSNFQVPQPSYRIDTKLAGPLAKLPGGSVEFGSNGRTTPSLAFRNLLRGRSIGLPSGQDVARAMCVEPIADDKLWAGDDVRKKALRDHPSFRGNAPLWFYVLREAELTRRKAAKDPEKLGGHHLGPVGGRIVAEVLTGLIWHDHHSYLYQAPNWKPTLPAASAGSFTMADLIRFTDS